MSVLAMEQCFALVARRHGVFALTGALCLGLLERAGLAPLVNGGAEGAWS